MLACVVHRVRGVCVCVGGCGLGGIPLRQCPSDFVSNMGRSFLIWYFPFGEAKTNTEAILGATENKTPPKLASSHFSWRPLVPLGFPCGVELHTKHPLVASYMGILPPTTFSGS